MATLRELLDEAGYDWDHGTLIMWLDDSGQACTVRSTEGTATRGTSNHPGLDKTFNNTSYGNGHKMPKFVAFSDRSIFVIAEYDGSTKVEKVPITAKAYIKGESCPIL